MKNWKIGTRIATGFGALIVIVMTLGIFAHAQIGALRKNSVDISENALPSVYMVGQIHSNVERLMARTLAHAISNDPAEMARIDSEIQGLRSANAEWMGSMKSSS